MLSLPNSPEVAPPLHIVSDLDQVILDHDKLLFTILEDMMGLEKNFFMQRGLTIDDLWDETDELIGSHIPEREFVKLIPHLPHGIETESALPGLHITGRVVDGVMTQYMVNGGYRRLSSGIHAEPITGVAGMFRAFQTIEGFNSYFSVLTSRPNSPRYHGLAKNFTHSENRMEVELLMNELLPDITFTGYGLVGNRIYEDQDSFAEKGEAFCERDGHVFLDDNHTYARSVLNEARGLGRDVVVILVGPQGEKGYELASSSNEVVLVEDMSHPEVQGQVLSLIQATFS